MRVVFIGAGNLATQLSRAMQNAGYDIEQVYSRTEESASVLARRLGCSYTTSLDDIFPEADMYMVALKDSALTELLPQITAGKPENSLFVHTAGSMPMYIWKGHARHYGVFYPMQTFSKARDVDFAVIPIFIEAGQDTDLEALKRLGNTLSETVMEADSELRRHAHLAAVFVCNFANHMFAIGEHLLQEHQLPFRVMYPLLKETAEKVLGGMRPSEAQTGPAVRYDENVMGKHSLLLSAYPVWRDLYERISKSIYHDKLRSEED